MLMVLFMLIRRAGDPETWRWLVSVTNDTPAPAGSDQPQAHRQGPPPPLPAATGPTDEDFDQSEAAKEEFQAVTDGTLQMQPEEMEAYDRMVEWVKNQSFARLYQRAEKGLWYTDLHDSPNKHRGDVIALNMDVRRAKCEGKNRYGVKLYEVWGLTDESRGRLYDMIILDYPRGMPLGYDINEKARFAGYFLKLQGYEAGSAKPGQAPEKAPLLIGRLDWKAPPVAAPTKNTRQEWTWGVVLVVVIGLIVALRFAYYRLARRKAARSRSGQTTAGSVIPIDVWLERANLDVADRPADVDAESDSSSENGKLDEPHKRGAEQFPDGLDGE
jgi:hypothetical protein